LNELGLSTASSGEGETVKRKVWRMQKEGFKEGSGGNGYFSE